MHSCVHNEQRFSWHIYLVNNSFWLDFFSNKPEICVISWSFLLLQISFFHKLCCMGHLLFLNFYHFTTLDGDMCTLTSVHLIT